MEKGEIIELGAFNDLIEKNEGFFKKIYHEKK